MQNGIHKRRKKSAFFEKVFLLLKKSGRFEKKNIRKTRKESGQVIFLNRSEKKYPNKSKNLCLIKNQFLVLKNQSGRFEKKISGKPEKIRPSLKKFEIS